MVGDGPSPSFREMLVGPRFCYGAELVTTRGTSETAPAARLVELGEALAADERIDWISVTDNPGGAPMLPADWLARILAERRSEVVIHLTCKDLNRNGLESSAWRFASEGFANLLALTGDYPSTGYGGLARPVFDLDSVGLIALLHAMNTGLPIPGRGGSEEVLPRTGFFIGCAVSPFKRHERELMPQFFKLARKLRCGAQWVIPQLGFDMRKFHEVLLFLQRSGPAVPVIGNVYILNKTVAGIFNKGTIPGCVVSERLYEQVRKYAAGPDKGRGFCQELAARQLAVFKGLGFAAGYLAGTMKADTFFRVIELAESYSADDWRQFAREIQYAQPDEFYLFEQDPETGLGDGANVNRAYLESLQSPRRTGNVSAGYRVARKVHGAFFARGKGQFDRMRRLYEHLEKKGEKRDAGIVSVALHVLERAGKSVAYGCKDCGDCSLPDCAYLCPNASCSKSARNGPCGGSADGRCELDDKQCMWARAYDRLKLYGETEQMLDGPAVFYDARLNGTSAWSNTYLGRDHHAEEGPAGDAKDAASSAPPSPTPAPSRAARTEDPPASAARVEQPESKQVE